MDGKSDGVREAVAAGEPRGCQPGGHSGFHNTDAIVGQVDVGESGSFDEPATAAAGLSLEGPEPGSAAGPGSSFATRRSQYPVPGTRDEAAGGEGRGGRAEHQESAAVDQQAIFP